ncbi:ABC transporter ATP-binding protein [Candidatus Bipolaricaulota bacterium]|nr:ABC transporter ATP-binding protein [Candidatus Bipolaricaulota bacterium]
MEQVALKVQSLGKRYGGVVAVDSLSFEVLVGHVFTLLGPNGAGKTTTLEMLEGIRIPDKGEIELFGRRLARIDRVAKQRMGVLLQEGNFEPYLRVREVIRLFASFFDRSIPVEKVLAMVALQEKERALVRSLSGGQRQRLALGVALVNDPDLVFLDEPTTGLDPQARRNIWDIVTDLKQRERTLILTTHYMDEAEALSDDVRIMDHGKLIAAGSPAALAAGLGQETILEFSAAGAAANEASRALDACCHEIRIDGETVIAHTMDLMQAMEQLLAWSKRKGVRLSNMVVRQPNLEDVFLSLTGRTLRE